MTSLDALLPEGRPYPGLRPFEASETHLFFGREEQVDALLARLHRSRLVAVVGESGAGKSSLVRAGLLPALEAGFLADAGADWRILLMRPGAAPLEALTDALLAPGVLSQGGGVPPHAFAAAELRRGPLGLLQLLRDTRLPLRTNLLLVVDQFEELFRFSNAARRDEADAFVDLLLHSVAQREWPVYLVLTMRSDYLGACARFRGLPEALNDNQFLTPRLTREQVGMAIAGPAHVFGGEVDPKLVATLENEVGDDPDQLPLLQHLLMRLWEQASREGLRPRLTLDLLGTLGGLHGALEQHLEQLFNTLTPAQQAICEGLFKAVTGGDHNARDLRRPACLDEVAATIGTDQAALCEVITVFRAPGRNFLMPPPEVALAPGTRLDISHESLIRQWPRLRAWVDAEAEDKHTFLDLRARAQRWAKSARDSAELATRNDLQRALAWRAQGTTNAAWASRYAPVDTDYALTLAFIEASAAEDRRQREEKRSALEREAAMAGKLLRLSGVLGVLGALAGLFGVFAFLAKEEAVAKGKQATALKLSSEARAAYFTGAPDALQKSLDAVLADPLSADAVMTLRRTTGSPVRVHQAEFRAPGNARPHSAADAFLRPFTLGTGSFDMQGTRIAIPVREGTRLHPLAPGKPAIVLDDRDTAVRAARFLQPDGERILTLRSDGVVRLWRADDGTLLHPLDHGGARISAAEPDATGERLVTAGRNKQGDGEAWLWDLIKGQRVDMRRPRYAGDDIPHAVFSPDGKHVLTLAEGGYVTVWDATTGAAVRELPFDRVVGESGTASERRASSCSEAVKAGIHFSPEGPDGRILAVLDRFGRGTLFDAATYALGTRSGWQLPAYERFCSIAWSHDGSRLAAATSEGRVRIWDARQGRRLPSLPRNADWAQTVVFHPRDATILLTSGGERGVVFWQLGGGGTSRAPIQIDLLRDPSLIHEAVFSPDGARLLTLSDDEAVRLWQLPEHGEQSTRFERLAEHDVAAPVVAALRARAEGGQSTASHLQLAHPQAGCHPLARSPDGQRVGLACTQSETAGRAVRHYLRLTRHGNADVEWPTSQPVAMAAFDQSGKRIGLALENGMLYVLDLENASGGEWRARPVEAARRRSDHAGRIVDLQFSGDGTLIATAGADASIRILDASTLRQLTLASLPGVADAVSFADHDRRILVGIDNGILAWRCPVCGSVDDLIERARLLLAEGGAPPRRTAPSVH